MNISPVQSHKTSLGKSLRSVVAILKCLIILSLNLCPAWKMRWDNDTFAWGLELRLTGGPMPHRLSAFLVWLSVAYFLTPGAPVHVQLPLPISTLDSALSATVRGWAWHRAGWGVYPHTAQGGAKEAHVTFGRRLGAHIQSSCQLCCIMHMCCYNF